MPLIIQNAVNPRCPGDFAFAEAPGYQLTESEQRCRDRVNAYVTRLATIDNDNTPRGQELINLRNRYVTLFHDRAEEVGRNELTAEEMLYTTFMYQGRFEAEAAHLSNATIFVSVAPADEGHTSVNFDIGPGTTTTQQADLLRAIMASQVVVDVVLKRPAAAQQQGWLAQHHYYIQRLAEIGRFGLTEGNLEFANGTLDALQAGFIVQQAEAVKNRYVRRLGFWAVLWILVNTVLYVSVCRYLAPNVRAGVIDGSFSFLGDMGDILWQFRNFFLLAIGSALGAWLAFLIQRPTLSFLNLAQLDENLLSPGIRVIFTIVLGTVVGLLFWTGMVVINIGDFSTNFHNAGTPAVLIGAFCGIASGALVAAVSRRAQEFAATVGGQAQPSNAQRGMPA